MNAIKKALLILALAASQAGNAVSPVKAQFTSSFSIRKQFNAAGDIRIIGNTLTTCINGALSNNTTGSKNTCDSARNGATTGTNPAVDQVNNNGFTVSDVNVVGGSGIFNSSTANLSLPTGATVLWAGLYWGAESTSAARNTVRFSVPGGGYISQTGVLIGTNTSDNSYHAFKDVTAAVKAAGSGTYSVANVQRATTGVNHWAAWSMVVVYEQANEPVRNLTVFDGYKVVNSTAPNNNITIGISGFRTPPSGAVNAKLGVVAYDGDRGSTGDNFTLNGTNLINTLNPTSNFFNSTITYLNSSSVNTRNPNYVNQLGFDIDLLNVSGRIPNNATSATLGLTTGGETYYPGVVTTAVDLYVPTVTITKTLADLNGGRVQVGDILEYTLVLTNQKDANGNGDPILNTVIRDPIPIYTTYVPNSLVIDSAAKSDVSGDDQAEFDSTNNRVVYRAGSGASATAGGRLEVSPAASSSTALRFRVKVNSGTPDNTQITNQASVTYNGQTLGVGTSLSDSSGNVAVAIASSHLNLVKRITAINGTALATIVDPNTTPEPDDNAPNFPANYLRGAINGGFVKPGDEVEYTIYFLSDGGVDASNVRICDVLPPDTTFLSTAFNSASGSSGLDRGVALAIGSTTPTTYLTNIADSDRGTLFSAGSSAPGLCSGSNVSGAIVVDVATGATTLAKATAPGTPPDSYGFVRFRVKVK